MDMQTIGNRARGYAQQAWVGYQQRRANAVQREATAQQNAAGQQVMEYTGSDAMQRGITEMARSGWRVASQTSYQPRAGCMRVVLLGGIGALVFKPRTKFSVVFTR